MRLFIAGICAIGLIPKAPAFQGFLNDREKHARLQMRNLLESYHYIEKSSLTVKRIRAAEEKVFLDSGAFSSFTKGVKVDLGKYCEFIQENKDIIEVASVLDSIGDAQKTYENQGKMERRNTSPLPCFHYNEDERYLEHYIANYPKITLGGMVPISTPQLIHWLDRIWDKYLTDSDGLPKLDVHAFGVTSQPLMARYPWYSVDSSSWVQTSAHGSILTPDWSTIPISRESPFRKVAGQHFLSMPLEFQKAIYRFITDNGWDYERLTIEGRGRSIFNCWVYSILQDRYTKDTLKFQRRQPELFN